MVCQSAVARAHGAATMLRVSRRLSVTRNAARRARSMWPDRVGGQGVVPRFSVGSSRRAAARCVVISYFPATAGWSSIFWHPRSRNSEPAGRKGSLRAHLTLRILSVVPLPVCCCALLLCHSERQSAKHHKCAHPATQSPLSTVVCPAILRTLCALVPWRMLMHGRCYIHEAHMKAYCTQKLTRERIA